MEVVSWARVTWKPLFGVNAQVRFKPNCSATETSENIEISPIGKFRYDTFQSANKQWRWADCPEAQVGLRLCGSHITKSTFFVLMPQLIYRLLSLLCVTQDTTNVESFCYLLLNPVHLIWNLRRWNLSLSPWWGFQWTDSVQNKWQCCEKEGKAWEKVPSKIFLLLLTHSKT